MSTNARLASLYNNKAARFRHAARGHIEQLQVRQQQEATAHRDRATRELAALDERHAQVHARYGTYRPQDDVLNAQRAERIQLRLRHRRAAERLAERHERELAEARRK